MAHPFILLRREILIESHTMGSLYVDDSFFCYTLEDPLREQFTEKGWEWRSEFKVYGKTAIPSGTYEVAVTYSNKFRRRMPLIMNVPDFVGIRFHTGRTVANTEGCPLLGRARDTDKGLLWDGDSLTEQLSVFIDGASKRGKVFCEIRNP